MSSLLGPLTGVSLAGSGFFMASPFGERDYASEGSVWQCSMHGRVETYTERAGLLGIF